MSHPPGRNSRLAASVSSVHAASGVDRPVLVELREIARPAVGDRQGRPVLPVGPDERARDPLGLQGLLEPSPRVTAQDRDDPHVATEPVRGARRVQPFPAGGLDEPERTVDPAGDQPFDLEQLVDRGVRGHAHDHAGNVTRRGRRPARSGARLAAWRRSRSSARAASSSRGGSSRTCARTRSCTGRSRSPSTTSTPNAWRTRSSRPTSSSSARTPDTASRRTSRGRPRSTAPTT